MVRTLTAWLVPACLLLAAAPAQAQSQDLRIVTNGFANAIPMLSAWLSGEDPDSSMRPMRTDTPAQAMDFAVSDVPHTIALLTQVKTALAIGHLPTVSAPTAPTRLALALSFAQNGDAQ